MQYTITFTDGTPTRVVQAESMGVGDGQLEFFTDAIPVGEPQVTVPIVDRDGASILASLSSAQG